MKIFTRRFSAYAALAAALSSCISSSESEDKTPRMIMFVGVDISGSFLRGPHFDDSMAFLAQYIYSHLNGHGGLEVPKDLFVGSIGGASAGEAKTFYPIETFQNESIAGIEGKLKRIFPKTKSNPFTDYNAFFSQIGETVKNRKLILKPISIIMISDGVPDDPKTGKKNFKMIELKPLEALSRNVTLRVLYTDPVTGQGWQTNVSRRRVKVWTQDATVMSQWKDPKISLPGVAPEKQDRLLSWIKNNVDFSVRARRVD